MKGVVSIRLVAWIIALALIALPVAGVLQGWFASGRWPVRELQVHATFRHVSAAEVRAAVAPSLGAGFFAIDLDKVRAAVAALPWVGQVEVGKHWPDALVITIREIHPIARWGNAALLGHNGHVYPVPDPGVAGSLPRFNAPDTRAADVLAFYRTARKDFMPHGLRVTQVDLSTRGSWTLTLSDGGRVVVGSEHPDQRLARFVAALPVLLRGRHSGFVYADLRYGNGFALRWSGPVAGVGATVNPVSRKRAAARPHAGKT